MSEARRKASVNCRTMHNYQAVFFSSRYTGQAREIRRFLKHKCLLLQQLTRIKANKIRLSMLKQLSQVKQAKYPTAILERISIRSLADDSKTFEKVI